MESKKTSSSFYYSNEEKQLPSYISQKHKSDIKEKDVVSKKEKLEAQAELDINTQQTIENDLLASSKLLYDYRYTDLNQTKTILSIKLRNYLEAKIIIKHIPIRRKEGIFTTSWLPTESFDSLEAVLNTVIAKEKLAVAMLKIRSLINGLNSDKAKEMKRNSLGNATDDIQNSKPKPLILCKEYWSESFNGHSNLSPFPEHAYTLRSDFLMTKWEEDQSGLPFEVWLKVYQVHHTYSTVNYKPECYNLSQDAHPEDGKYLYVLDCNERFILIKETNNDSHHHSSIVQGGAVLCAGNIKIKKGEVVYIDYQSGHYRPHLENFIYALKKLINQKIPIESSYRAALENEISKKNL